MRIHKPTEETALYNLTKTENQEKRKHQIGVWRAKEDKTFAQFIKEQLKEEEHAD